MIPRWLKRRGWTNIHIFGCALLILVSYKVWYSALTNSDDMKVQELKRSEGDGSFTDKRTKARYRYERYANRNKENVGSPGEKGEAVVLKGKDAALADSLFKKEAFNIIASNRISLNRTLPDIRDPA